MHWACPCPCADNQQAKKESARLRATHLGGCWARWQAAPRLRLLRPVSRLLLCLQACPRLDLCTAAAFRVSGNSDSA